MVGLPGEMSNMAPPTVCLLVLVVGQVAGLMLVRPVLAAWLDRARPWFTVVLVGSVAMTLYLWHLPVLVVGFAALLWLDVPLPLPGTAEWWLSRPVWCALLAVLLGALAARLARFERYGGNRVQASGGRPAAAGDNDTLLAGAGTVAAAAGLFGFVLGGLTPSFTLAVSLAALACGLALTTRSTRATPTCGYTLGGYGVAYESNKTCGARRLMTTNTFQVQGMTCGHCVSAVSSEIGRLSGVSEVSVDLDSGEVTVVAEQPLAQDDVRAAVEEAGYELVG
jgi:copper ion binding protein